MGRGSIDASGSIITSLVISSKNDSMRFLSSHEAHGATKIDLYEEWVSIEL
jgi:hypothetical protein